MNIIDRTAFLQLSNPPLCFSKLNRIIFLIVLENNKNYFYLFQTQEVLTFTLASFRVNRLFDYSKLLSDNKARCLVKSTHTSLNSCVQKKLEEANKKRFDRGDLTYQYMEPKWLPNSIHN